MTDPLRATLQDSLGSAYTLKTEIGGGGMSRVFVAHEESLGRDVVVKVLAPELAEGLSVERFTREIRLAAALQEPHIVPLLTAGVTSLGMPYYTMPFVRGASLRERMSRGPIAANEALDLLRDVAHALAYAHTQGIVHRDIKPENILLSSGTAVVTDFGIAKALQVSRSADTDGLARKGITRTGMSLGTPAYMAPEQAAGDPTTDQRADLYAWGVVAYELLAGRHPFANSTSPQALLTAHMVEVPEVMPPERDVAPAIAALVTRCLAKDPDDRPASAIDVLRELTDARTKGSREGAVKRGVLRDATAMSKISARRRAIVIAGIAVLATVSAGVLWSNTHRRAGDAATASGPVMMAVLPFEHAGPADQQPFTDGLTDAVTAKLGALSSLLVIDRRSAATYRGTTKSTQQIGTELGVRYLLEGVVRWARDGGGVWRARVTPTLVDVKSGAIKWTGEPAAVSLDDPFTAQASIATDVAQAMEVVVMPTEREELQRRLTKDPRAYTALLRAGATLRNAYRNHEDVRAATARAEHDLHIAIALDSNFALAWSQLADFELNFSLVDFADTAVTNRARRVISEALRRAPNEPGVLLAAAGFSESIDRNRTLAESLTAKALRLGGNSVSTLSGALYLTLKHDPDSARKLALKAAMLSPRSIASNYTAAIMSTRQRRWADARSLSDAVIGLDSTDERGWIALVRAEIAAGDSVAIRRVSERALRSISSPSLQLTCDMAYGSQALSRSLLGMSATQLRVATLSDSAYYYDCKTDAALRVSGTAVGRALSDSIVALLTRPDGTLRVTGDLLGNEEILALAFAYANTSNPQMAVRLLDTVFQATARLDNGGAPVDLVSAERVAATYVAIGDTQNAIKWLQRSVSQGYSVRWLAISPRLHRLHNTAEFARFVRTNEQ